MKEERRNKRQIRVHRQRWADFDLFFLIHPHGVAQLEIYPEPLNSHIGNCKAYFCNLWVDAEYRKGGTGNELLRGAEDLAITEGLDSIALKHDHRDTEAWVAEWYKRKGYEERLFGETHCLMVKQLKTN